MLIHRVYEDYLKPSRLEEYKALLETAKIAGYTMVGILDFYRLVSNKSLNERSLVLVNRHDVDTSPKVAGKLFDIEQEVYGSDGSATYYFRRTTIDKSLIKRIDRAGYETGYHYEELSDYIKKNRIRNENEIRKSFPEVRRIFLDNIKDFRETTGSMSKTVASHGDFINVRFDIQNYEFMQDQNIREKAKVELEAYDNEITDYIVKRLADHTLEACFTNEAIESIKANYPVIMLLTHPRNWQIDWVENTKENFRRLFQDICYRL